jgi:O-antigen ligase
VIRSVERVDTRGVVAALVAMSLAIGAGVATAARPDAWILMVSPFVVIALWISPSFRLAFVVLGGLIVLGPPELTTSKLSYFAGVLVATVATARSLLSRGRILPKEVVRLISLSTISAVLLGLPAAFRLASGTDPASVLRDLAPYFLLVVAPMFAIDAAARLSLNRLTEIAAAGLALGCAAFLLSWSIRRDIFVGQSGTIIFGGFFMPVALLILSVVCLTEDRVHRRPLWLALAGLAAATAIVTGTRSFLLEIPAVLVAVAITGPTASSRIRRVVLVPAVVVASGAVLTFAIVTVLGFDVQSIAGRWSLLISAVSDPSSDVSLTSRAAQTDNAWRLFQSSPIFGLATGLPTTLANGDPAGDTPIALLADYGLVGLTAVLALLAGWIGLVFRRPQEPRWPAATMIGMLVAAVTYSLILPIVQDKGLGFAFILVGALVIRTLLEPERAGREATAGRGAFGFRTIDSSPWPGSRRERHDS